MYTMHNIGLTELCTKILLFTIKKTVNISPSTPSKSILYTNLLVDKLH